MKDEKFEMQLLLQFPFCLLHVRQIILAQYFNGWTWELSLKKQLCWSSMEDNRGGNIIQGAEDNEEELSSKNSLHSYAIWKHLSVFAAIDIYC